MRTHSFPNRRIAAFGLSFPKHFVACVFVLLCMWSAKAQKGATIDDVLAGFRSADSQVRSRAFYTLMDSGTEGGFQGRTWMIQAVMKKVLLSNPSKADQIQTEIIRLLERENAVVDRSNSAFRNGSGKQPLGEEYVNYWGDLIAAVAALNDPRSIEGLVGAITSGGIAENALARMGDPAIDSVIAKLLHGDELARAAATRVLSKMLDPENMARVSGSSSRKKLQEAFVRAASDRNPFVRKAAAEGLGKLRDSGTRQLLLGLARNDPYEASMHGGKKGVFPVREAARKALNGW